MKAAVTLLFHLKAAVTLLLHLLVLLCLSSTVVQGQELDEPIAHLKEMSAAHHQKHIEGDLWLELGKAVNRIERLETRNAALQNDVAAMKTESSERKVAFHAGLRAHRRRAAWVGPFKTEITLVFRNVLTNIGEAYSPLTGVFTAPVRGLYYFRFTGYDFHKRHMGVILYHNNLAVPYNDISAEATGGRISSALTVDLEEGDLVKLNLRAALQNDVAAMKTESSERKVAFHAGLRAHRRRAAWVGPFKTEITLVFRNVLTNIGEAYSPLTGVFTAPVRGLYYFRFTGYDFHKRHMGVILYHNNLAVPYNDISAEATGGRISSALTVDLEEGDLVKLNLRAGEALYDNPNRLITFTGFMLFPM